MDKRQADSSVSSFERDYGAEKGIADEPTIDQFVDSIGGTRLTELFPRPTFQNADYYLSEHRAVIELKILETELTRGKEFGSKRDALIEKFVREHGMRGPMLGQPWPVDFVQEFYRLFRPALARIAKKANRQLKETKAVLSAAGHNPEFGILLCVNDNLRSVPPAVVMGLFGDVLANAYSSVDAFIYLTNHYVDVPGSDYANILWAPLYSPGAPEELVEIVNRLGRRWFDFAEQVQGPSDHRTELPSISLEEIRIIPPRGASE